ncbi:hypothetical protein WMY93_019091 [Mugilogobius chulae]|uniref:ENPP1-3/EXOG-like endonuclease/phosphodiesterase domain-containing protein n=1 Tax=Mugilogobius chulae TaxID=88201 RepID=A0AAW0NEK3_9GOBI
MEEDKNCLEEEKVVLLDSGLVLSDVSTLQTCLRADPRVSPVHSQSCSVYHQHQQLSYGFLFPPELASSAESRYDASLVTNTVPMFPAFKKVWSYLQGALFRRYAQENNGINVLVGPVFDQNYDGLRDTDEQIREYTSDSPPVFSFILPNREDNTEACNSLESESEWVEDLLKMHTARVRDIEILTGLDLFRSTNMTQVEVLKLKTDCGPSRTTTEAYLKTPRKCPETGAETEIRLKQTHNRSKKHDQSKLATRAKPRPEQNHKLTTGANSRPEQSYDQSKATTKSKTRPKQKHDQSKLMTGEKARPEQSHD